MLFDKDKSSRLSLNEFQGVLTQAGAKVSDKEASVIF
jgi:Ca2+-binding EF-hand superfamily protein